MTTEEKLIEAENNLIAAMQTLKEDMALNKSEPCPQNYSDMIKSRAWVKKLIDRINYLEPMC